MPEGPIDPVADSWQLALDQFRTNLASVDKLLTFDQVILDHAIDLLEKLTQDLEERNVHTGATTVRHYATALRNIRTNQSLQRQYQVIFNQCVVLLVSYFDSAMHDLFLDAVVTALRNNASVKARNESLTIAWSQIESADGDREELFAELLVAQKKYSFQDMQSITRAFESQLGTQLEREKTEMNNIILGQAARHVIVHARSVVDRRMIEQVKDARPRDLFPDLRRGSPLAFTPSDVRTLARSMEQFFGKVCIALHHLGPRVDRRRGRSE